MSKSKPYLALAASFILVISTILCTYAAFHYTSPVANWIPAGYPINQPIILDIKATIDGHETLDLSPQGAVWMHQDYQWPTDVAVHDAPLGFHTRPKLNNTGLGDVDLSTRKLVPLSDREKVELQNTPDSIDFHFNLQPPIDPTQTLNLSPQIGVRSHQAYRWPTNITVNDIPWDVHAQPTLTRTGLADIDLSTARVISLTGRGHLGMQHAADGLVIHFDDPQPGAAPYEIKIRINRK